MQKKFVIFALFGVSLVACSRGPRPITVSALEQARCVGVSDSLSRYVSADALPFAHLVGTPRILPAPPALRRGDSITVEFLVLPTGLADPTTLEIVGTTDPGFTRSVQQLLAQSSFVPGRVSSCNVLSRYNLVVKPAA
ncbi:MAG TPA: hypothetical protein VD771_10675 [Gemmatimonadaceae bacterium]|nr:hypothetical protein [Gemmatimonadaceae bacterium]